MNAFILSQNPCVSIVCHDLNERVTVGFAILRSVNPRLPVEIDVLCRPRSNKKNKYKYERDR